jgi:hypothetical protein
MGTALMGLHGQTPRLMWGMYPERAAGVWALTDRFDTDTAVFKPYYRPEEQVLQASNKDVLASAYVHPGKRALVLLCNWSDKPAQESIRINWKKLGLKPQQSVLLYAHNRQVAVREGRIQLNLPPKQIVYLWIGGLTPDTAPRKAIKVM